MKRPLPMLDLHRLAEVLTPDELALVQGIVNPRTGALRASKPPIKRAWQTSVLTGEPVRVYDLDDAKTAYLWRMVAFTLSPVPAHGCLPVCAALDLPVYGAERRALTDYLDTLVDRVVRTVPKAQWYGTARWARAYGL